MAICPFADQHPISGPSGAYKTGPFKIVHHTTEGGSAQGAFDAFKLKKADPHFTVDRTTIFQHIDTGKGARALRHPAPPETNLASAVQIEVVGQAAAPKDKATLTNVARLLRWIEATHHVPREWPNGPPKPPVHGKDPGGHNRDLHNWETKSGHYGHSHVPGNTHWDPAYSAVEAAFLLSAEFDAHGVLTNKMLPAVKALLDRHVVAGFGPGDKVEVMLDHMDVGETP